MVVKHAIRHKYLAIREKLSSDFAKKCSVVIAERVLAIASVRSAKRICAYLPINNEVDTRKIIDDLLLRNQQVFLPKYFKYRDEYGLAHFKDWKTLEAGPHQILEPAGSLEIDPDEIEVAILPGLAFDSEGVRLGYGKGIFDKLLGGSRAFKIGLAYDFQIVEKLPREKHDLVMDLVVTEKRIIKVGS